MKKSTGDYICKECIRKKEGKEQWRVEWVDMTDTGLVGLVLAIFRGTAQDLRYGSKGAKKSANEFLDSQWFEELCVLFPTDPKRIRHMIRNNKVAWRDKYE